MSRNINNFTFDWENRNSLTSIKEIEEIHSSPPKAILSDGDWYRKVLLTNSILYHIIWSDERFDYNYTSLLVSRRETWRIKGFTEEKKALIVNALFVQNVRGKSISIVKIIKPRLCIKVLVNEDTLLRTHHCPWRFLGCTNWEKGGKFLKKLWCCVGGSITR